jgi:hypothetical protein
LPPWLRAAGKSLVVVDWMEIRPERHAMAPPHHRRIRRLPFGGAIVRADLLNIRA